MSAAGPSQGANSAPYGGSAAASAASVGVVNMATLAANAGAPSRSPSSLLMRKLFRRKVVLAGAVILALVVLLAVFAPWLTPYDPMALRILDRMQSPRAAHWFGTDELGRDVFSRVVYGARYSLMIGAAVVLISVTGGVLLGLVAGFFRRLDGPIMRVVDAMMSFPDILLAIALVAVLGASITNVILALSIVYTPRVARVVRASTLVVRELLFIEAARALGIAIILAALSLQMVGDGFRDLLDPKLRKAL